MNRHIIARTTVVYLGYCWRLLGRTGTDGGGVVQQYLCTAVDHQQPQLMQPRQAAQLLLPAAAIAVFPSTAAAAGGSWIALPLPFLLPWLQHDW